VERNTEALDLDPHNVWDKSTNSVYLESVQRGTYIFM